VKKSRAVEASIRLIRVTPDGNCAVSVSANGTLQLWDVKSGSEMHRMTGHRAAVTEAAFIQDGSAVVSASEDRSIRVWDVNTGTEIASFFADSPVASCAVVSAPPTIVAGDHFGRTYFLRIEGLAGTIDKEERRVRRECEPRKESYTRPRRKFDVFLCHNSADKAAV
jgi:WD40 repeat protein